ncbi:hypothetical protein VTN02DRAFT_2686 [Thermoascus thermophilus]
MSLRAGSDAFRDAFRGDVDGLSTGPAGIVKRSCTSLGLTRGCNQLPQAKACRPIIRTASAPASAHPCEHTQSTAGGWGRPLITAAVAVGVDRHGQIKILYMIDRLPRRSSPPRVWHLAEGVKPGGRAPAAGTGIFHSRSLLPASKISATRDRGGPEVEDVHR